MYTPEYKLEGAVIFCGHLSTHCANQRHHKKEAMRLCSHVHARWPEQLTAKVSANARAMRDHPIVCEEEPPPPPPTPLLLRWCSFDTASATARNRSTLEQNVASMRRLVPCHYLSSGVCREKKLIHETNTFQGPVENTSLGIALFPPHKGT